MGADDGRTDAVFAEIGVDRRLAVLIRQFREGVARRFGHRAAEAFHLLVHHLGIDVDDLHFDRPGLFGLVGHNRLRHRLLDRFVFPEGGIEFHLHGESSPYFLHLLKKVSSSGLSKSFFRIMFWCCAHFVTGGEAVASFGSTEDERLPRSFAPWVLASPLKRAGS